MKIGQKIKALREERNWSQSDLAAALEESRQSVARWEKGDSLPELDRLIHLSMLFEIPLTELAGEQLREYELDGVELPEKLREKRRKDRILLCFKLLAVAILILMGIIVNMVWIKFLLRFL